MFYKYDIKTGKFLGKIKNAYYTPDGKLVEGYTRIAPEKEDEHLYFENGKWVIKEELKDFRGKWVNENGDEIIIKDIGEEPPEDYYQLKNREYRNKSGMLHEYMTKQFILSQKKSEIMTIIDERKNQLREQLLNAFIEFLAGTDLSSLQNKYSKILSDYNSLDKFKATILKDLENKSFNELVNYKVSFDVTK